jgi:hypothetical protein
VADPKRLRVKKELSAWLEGITPANGFQHDLTGKVFRGRDRFGEADPLPALAILEPLNPDRDINEAGTGRVVNEQMVLLIQGWVAMDPDDPNPTDAADLLLADAKQRVGQLIGNDLPPHQMQAHHNLYGLVNEVLVEPGTVRPPDQFSALAYCYFRVAFGFAEKIDDPYGV